MCQFLQLDDADVTYLHVLTYKQNTSDALFSLFLILVRYQYDTDEMSRYQ